MRAEGSPSVDVLDHDAPGSVFASPSFRKVWLSGLVVASSALGQNVARAWIAQRITGTNAGLGGVLFAFGVPAVLLAPFAGVATDRYPKRSVMASSELVMATAALFVGVALVLGVLEYWMLLLAAGLQGIGFVFFGPALIAITPELVDRTQIARGVNFHHIALELMRVVAPLVAGFLLTLDSTGEEIVFLGGAVQLAVAALIVWRVPVRPSTRVPSRSPFAELRSGFGYAFGRRHLRLLMSAFCVAVILGFPYLTFLPTVAESFDVGARGFGVMSAFVALGAVLGAVSGVWFGVRALWGRLLSGGLLFSVAVVALGLAPAYWMALVVLVVLGLGWVTFLTSGQSLVLTISDLDYHGRLQSILQISMTGWGFVALPLGFLADEVGLRWTLGSIGLSVFAIVATLAIRGSKHRELLRVRELG